MLNKKYDISFVGLNYVSLIKGIVELKNKKSVLTIDDEKYRFANNWCLNIGEVELQLLIQLGTENNIDILKGIKSYLQPTNTLLHLDDMFIEFADSPFAGVKELARKFPRSFSHFFKTKLVDLDVDIFDEKITALNQQLALKSMFVSDEKDLSFFLLNFDPLLGDIFRRFHAFLQEQGENNQELHFALQMMFQTNFSTKVTELGSIYLLLSLISPRYTVDREKLTNDLAFEYHSLGGDLKQTTVEDWGVEETELKYILLSSVDGLISVDNCYYFAQLNEPQHLTLNKNLNHYLSIKLNCILDHSFVESFSNKRIVFLKKNRMGSDFPYWEVQIDKDGFLEGTYAYADNLGTKPSFYYHHALEDLYESLRKLLPGLDRTEWISRTKLTRGDDLWVSVPKDQGKQAPAFLQLHPEKMPIDKMFYNGPDKAHHLGFYGYLQNIFTPN